MTGSRNVKHLGTPTGTGALVDLLRTRVDGPGPDRYLAPDLGAAESLLLDRALEAALERHGIRVS